MAFKASFLGHGPRAPTRALALLLLTASSNAHITLPRSLLTSGSADCGLAYQPCCSWGESCQNSLACIEREGGPRCEPCGTPFSQPCPQSPYCETLELIPTTRAIFLYLDIPFTSLAFPTPKRQGMSNRCRCMSESCTSSGSA
jgi:hypothetical protein